MNRNFLWLIIVIVLVALTLFLLGGGIKTDNSENTGNTSSTGASATENETLTPATGNIDDTVSAVLNAVSGDDLAPEETNPSLIETGGGLLGEFDQSFDLSGL